MTVAAAADDRKALGRRAFTPLGTKAPQDRPELPRLCPAQLSCGSEADAFLPGAFLPGLSFNLFFSDGRRIRLATRKPLAGKPPLRCGRGATGRTDEEIASTLSCEAFMRE
jgi:hypothetical protein